MTAAEFCNSESECAIRADLRTLYVGPALGPLTRQPTNFRAENKNGGLTIVIIIIIIIIKQILLQCSSLV